MYSSTLFLNALPMKTGTNLRDTVARRIAICWEKQCEI